MLATDKYKYIQLNLKHNLINYTHLQSEFIGTGLRTAPDPVAGPSPSGPPASALVHTKPKNIITEKI